MLEPESVRENIDPQHTGNAEIMEDGYQSRAEELYAACLASRKIPGAWDAWRDYRAQVTGYVIQNSLPGTSLAVFGAGRCNDFDLGLLLNHFSQVTLLDVDGMAMREAVKFQLLQEFGAVRENPLRLKMFPVDFVGIAGEEYVAFARALLRYFDGQEKASFRAAADCLSRMYDKSRGHTIRLPEGQYDYTVALGVHSQLGNVPAWLLHAAGARAKAMESQGREGAWPQTAGLLDRMEQESTFLSERLNAVILSASRKKAFIGCEVSRAVPSPDGWYAVRDSAVTGAWQAVMDVERLAEAGRVRFGHYLDIVWPFCASENKAYRMMVMEVAR